MRKVSIKGVVIGGVVDVVTSTVLGIPFAIYEMAKTHTSHSSSDRTGTAVTAAIHADIPLYITSLLVGLACSVFGGYVAAWLAKQSELLNGALSSFLCVTIGILTIASGKDSSSLWVQVILLVASPIMALWGGDMMRRWRQSHARPA